MDLTNQDLQNFYGCSEKTARSRKREIKNALGIHKEGRVHITQLAKYEGLSIPDVKMILGIC